MGKRNPRRRHATTDSVPVNEEDQPEKLKLLVALEALFEKRSSTREKALMTIIKAFTFGMQHEFLEKNFAALLHQCLASIKKGSAKEISLACHAIGLLALTVGYDRTAQEIFEDSFRALLKALKSGTDPTSISSILKCLAIVTFVGANTQEDTEKSMKIMWQVVHLKLSSNVVAIKPTPQIITAAVSAWAFILSSGNNYKLDVKRWQEPISFLSRLLDKEDRSVRIVAGQALALLFERGSFEKFSSSVDGSAQDEKEHCESLGRIQGLRAKVLNQVRSLSMEAGGKGVTKAGLNIQRSVFKGILRFLEESDGHEPGNSTNILHRDCYRTRQHGLN